MTKIKRLFAVIFLLLFIGILAYSCYTGNQVASDLPETETPAFVKGWEDG